MKKKVYFYRSRVAKALTELWFVSNLFSIDDYECYVACTMYYFAHPSSYVPLIFAERMVFNDLAKLVVKFSKQYPSLTLIDTKFYNV